VSGGHHDHRHARGHPQSFAHVRPGHPREHEVEQHEVRALGVEALQRGRPVAGDGDVEALLAEEKCQRIRQRVLVLHDQHPGHGTWSSPCLTGSVAGDSPPAAGSTWAGSSRVKVDPVPGRLHSVTTPLWFWATCLTIARPSPVPPVARERALSTRKKRSKTRPWCSGAMPMPRSVTRSDTTLPSMARVMDTGVRSGE